jgi:hypothetical protein
MNQVIKDLVEKFEAELGAMLREHALESVMGLLDTVAGDAAPKKAKARAKSVTNGHNPPNRKAKKSGKRTPEALEALTKDLLAAIKAAPGSSIEAIGKLMGVPTKELSLPVAKLWEAKAIKTKGQKRATKYFAK